MPSYQTEEIENIVLYSYERNGKEYHTGCRDIAIIRTDQDFIHREIIFSEEDVEIEKLAIEK